MKLNIREIRKQPEGPYFEQFLDLASDEKFVIKNFILR